MKTKHTIEVILIRNNSNSTVVFPRGNLQDTFSKVWGRGGGGEGGRGWKKKRALFSRQ